MGPRIDPCGTPGSKWVHELKVVLILTLVGNLIELQALQ